MDGAGKDGEPFIAIKFLGLFCGCKEARRAPREVEPSNNNFVFAAPGEAQANAGRIVDLDALQCLALQQEEEELHCCVVDIDAQTEETVQSPSTVRIVDIDEQANEEELSQPGEEDEAPAAAQAKGEVVEAMPWHAQPEAPPLYEVHHPDFSGTWKCEFIHGDMHGILRKLGLGYLTWNAARIAHYFPSQGTMRTVGYKDDDLVVYERNFEDVHKIGVGIDHSSPPKKRVIGWEDGRQVLVIDILGSCPQKWRWSLQDATTKCIEWYCDGITVHFLWRRLTISDANNVNVTMPEKMLKIKNADLELSACATANLTPDDIDLMRDLQSLVDSTDWVNIDVKEGTERFIKKKRGFCGADIIKGSTTAACQFGFACEVVSDFEWFEDMMRITDVLFFEGRVVEKFDDSHALLYAAFNLPGLRFGRDFVWTGLSAITPERHLYICGKSVQNSEVAPREADRLVRGDMDCVGYLIREVEPGRLAVDYVAKVDPQGNLPAWVVNVAAKEQCDNVTRLRKFLEHNSP